MKTIVTIRFLFLALFFVSAPGVAIDDFAGGSGTQEDPYLVESADHLNNVRNYLDKHFKQIDDIDLSDYENGEGWDPIGERHDEFTGTFDGAQYIITNLSIDRESDEIGLFGALEGKLTDIGLEDVEVSGERDVGGLVGMSDGEIIDCYVTGTVTGSDNMVGGLVGWNVEGTITRSHAEVEVTGSTRTGGLVGWDGGQITDSFATGDVTGNAARTGGLVGYKSEGDITGSFAEGAVTGEHMHTGGLVGWADDDSIISESYATGEVEGEDNVGGLAGSNWEGTITNSYSAGHVSGDTNVGGLVGDNDGGEVENSYYDQETSNQDDEGKGIPKTTEEMMKEDTFDNWDFEETWDILEEESYPFLRWEVTADFAAEPTAGLSPLEVQFTDKSIVDIDTWEWDFGDGNTSHEQNPSHTYWLIGTYTVTLKVTGELGTDIMEKEISVYEEELEADFSAVPMEGEAPLEVELTDESSGPIDSWQWDFGDDNSSEVQNPVHEYETAGTYTVTLTVSGDLGEDTAEQTIEVYEPLAANFTGEPTEGTAPLTVEFTDTSEGNIDSWQWEFGDGETSDQQHPVHTYEEVGDYSVSLTVIDEDRPNGEDTLERVNYINVVDFAGGSGTQADPYLVETAEQLDNVRNHLDAHFEQIADIDLAVYNDEEGWESIGSYLTAFTGTYDGNNYQISNLFIDRPDMNYIGLFASVSGELSNVSLQDAEVTGDTGVGALAGISNGSISNSHAEGNVTGNEGVGVLAGAVLGNSLTKHSFAMGKVTGTESTGGLIGGIQGGTINGCYTTSTVNGEYEVGGLIGTIKEEHSLLSESYATGEVTGKQNVGGLVGLKEQGDVQYSYYDKETTGQDDAGKGIPKTTKEMMQKETFQEWDFDKRWNIIEEVTYPRLYRELVAYFIAGPGKGSVPLEVEFTDHSIGFIDSWQWDFDDGETCDERHPVHTFEEAGTYEVTLTIENTNRKDTFTEEINVYEAPQAAFTAEPEEGITPLDVAFTDESAGDIETWYWDFGDGTTSFQQYPQHTYPEEGTYEVALFIICEHNGMDFTSQTLTVIEPEKEYDAGIVSYDIPSLYKEKEEELTIKVRNTGYTEWEKESGIYLGAVDNEDKLVPPENWRVGLTHDVEPAQTHIFTIQVYPEQTGLFLTEWQMVKEDGGWFGEILSKRVEVTQYTGVDGSLWRLLK